MAQKACSSRLAVPLNLPGSGSSNGGSSGGTSGGGGGANGDFQQGAAAVLERLATAAGEEEAEARAAAAPAGELYMEVEIGEAQGSTILNTQGGPAEAGAEAKAEGAEPPTVTPESPLRERESRDYADFVARQSTSSTSTTPPLVWATASGSGSGARCSLSELEQNEVAVVEGATALAMGCKQSGSRAAAANIARGGGGAAGLAAAPLAEAAMAAADRATAARCIATSLALAVDTPNTVGTARAVGAVVEDKMRHLLLSPPSP